MAIIDKPSDYFNTNLYTGNNTETSHTGIGFQPDLTWLKVRNASGSHYWFDAIRGVNNYIRSDRTDAEGTLAETLESFDSDGYTVGTSNAVNTNGETMVGWNWLAGGTASSNTDGSITSSVSANQDAGFSIVSYTGNGTAGATVGHGLVGSVPKMVIVKDIDDARDWSVYHASLGATKTLFLNTTAAQTTSVFYWNNTSPTSSLFTIAEASETNRNGDTHIAYCFAEKQGYSKFGSYTGNNSNDGTFVYTGMKPAWVLIKRINSPANWILKDNKRDSYNVATQTLLPNSSSAEYNDGAYNTIDFLSNGFKLRGGSSGVGNDTNASEPYIYMAFAENPFVTSTGVPATAR